MSHIWFIHSSGYVGYFTIEKKYYSVTCRPKNCLNSVMNMCIKLNNQRFLSEFKV